MSNREYSAALQLEDERVLERCRLALYEEGINYKTLPLSKVNSTQLPEWVRPGDGGWLLMIEKAHYRNGMKRLHQVMGRDPDDDAA